MVNTAVRLIVLAFVFIGGAITLAGPQLVTGQTVAMPDKPVAKKIPDGSKLTTSSNSSNKDSVQAPDTSG
jgi:hypothetical protein